MLARVIASIAGVAICASGAGLVLAENGRSAYTIVIAPTASPSERHAAGELQNFLEQMSGARLPVATAPADRMVLVGDSPALQALYLQIPFAELGAEEFVLKTAGPHLVIAGGRLRGSMYGVYTFLEELGCRWFAVGVSRIPHLPTIAVPPRDEIRKPAFEYREPFFNEAADRDWAARNRVNGVLMNLDEATGGKVQYYPFVHTFNALVPPEKYFREHPEYFSLIDGKRRAERSQLCLTNPDVLRIGVESVERWIGEHPEASIFSVSQNDWTGWCECDNCRRVEREEGGAHSGPLLRYVNALAAEIEKKHPDKLIDTLAYWHTEDPPAHARPRPNVRIRLCPICVCEAHPYQRCAYSAYFLKNLEAWSRITSQLYIWHYNTNFAHYLLPFPDFDELAADVPMYRDHGVVGLFMEGSVTKGGGAENAELRSYVMAKLLWDAHTDVARAVAEFHEAFYGKAAPFMLRYFDLMQQQVRTPPAGLGRHMWIFDSAGASYLNDAFVARAARLFRGAEAAAESDAVRMRVRKARLGIDYVRLTRAKQYFVKGEWYRPADLAGLKQRWSSFIAELGRFGITNLSEATTIPADERSFNEAMQRYRVATIENERLRVRIVPQLKGRIIQIFDKQRGRELLAQPDPSIKWYPDLGGLTVTPYSDFTAPVTWPVNWQVAPERSATELRLNAICANGLGMKRTLRLDGGVLHTVTVLENEGKAPVEALLQSRWELDPGPLETARVRYRTQDGRSVDARVLEPEMQASGSMPATGADLPDAEWGLASGRTELVNRFAKDQVVRCFLEWTAKNGSRVGMAVSSPKRMLKPGDSLTLKVDYGVR